MSKLTPEQQEQYKEKGFIAPLDALNKEEAEKYCKQEINKKISK